MRAGVLIAVVAALVAAPVAHAAPPDWAPFGKATIHPGVVMFTEGGGCTSNFIFYGGGEIYIGFAAHCARSADDEAVDVQGENCQFSTLPLGAPVRIEGASRRGQLAYSSWRLMTERGEPDLHACTGNDFALVRIDPADHGKVNPSVPVYGGPTGLRRGSVDAGEKLLSFGRSNLRFDIEPLKPREGYVTLSDSEDWTHRAYFVTPGVFGDSGSAVLDAAGSATGALVTLTTIPPGGNGIVDLARAVDYMERHGGPQVTLAMGTEAFTGPQLGPGLQASPDPQPDPEPPPAAAPAAAPPPPPPATSPSSQPPPRKGAAPKRKAKSQPKKKCRKARGKKRSGKRCRKPRRSRR